MLPYLITFLASCSLLALAPKVKYKSIGIALTIVALLLPCVLAAIRSTSTGTDTRVYAKPLFDKAMAADNFSEYISSGWSVGWGIKWVRNFEIGFSSLIYWIAKLFGEFPAVLFSIQILISAPLYLGLKQYPALKNKLWLPFAIYYLLFFNLGLNAMRQMIGVSIVFYGISIVLNHDKRDFTFVVLIILAALFHKTSLMGLLLYAILKLIKYGEVSKDKKNSQRKIVKILLIFSLIGALILISNRTLLLGLINYFGFNEYSGYIVKNAGIGIQLLSRLPVAFLLIFNVKSMRKNDKWQMTSFLFTTLAIDLLVASLSVASTYASRIGYLFQFFYIVALSNLCLIDENSKRQHRNELLALTYGVIYWVFMYGYMGVGQTVPYLIG